MAWTATLLSGVDRVGGNIAAIVEFSDGTKSFQRDFSASDLTPQALAQNIARIIALLDARDARFAAIKAMEGTAITPQAPPAPDATLPVFVTRWNRLMRLKRLGSTVPALVTLQANLQGQVETYLQANPTALDEVMLG